MRGRAWMLCAFLAVQSPSQNAALDAVYSVAVRSVEGDTFCDVKVGRAPLLHVVRDLVDQLGWTLEGLADQRARVTVTAHLEDRPINDVLEFLLGSAGLQHELRNGTVFVRRIEPLEEAADVVHQTALAAYLRVARRFPAGDETPSVLLGQGEVEALRGNIENAKNIYLELADRFPSAPLTTQALLRAARHLVELERWDRAEEVLGRLLYNVVDDETDTEARLTIARCTLELGNAQRALYALEAVDRLHPPENRTEVQERLYLKARAQNGVGRHEEALATLDEADAFGLDPDSQRTSLPARALALEALGAPAEAARAWLAFAQLETGDPRGAALASAARLSLESGDELGTLFICQHAEGVGAAEHVEEYARAVRVALGLDPRGSTGTTWQQRLARAERLFDSALPDEALAILDDLSVLRDQMTPEELVRFSSLWARAIEQEESLEVALTVLREALPTLEDEEQRRSLYLLGARLLEEHGRFEEAVDAYRGKL